MNNLFSIHILNEVSAKHKSILCGPGTYVMHIWLCLECFHVIQDKLNTKYYYWEAKKSPGADQILIELNQGGGKTLCSENHGLIYVDIV
jgi:hypothetical protein